MFFVSRMHFLSSVFTMTTIGAVAHAQEAQLCTSELERVQNVGQTASASSQAKLNSVVAEMQADINKAQDENPIPNYSKEEMVINFTLDVKWKNQDIIFDVPQVTMRLQEWKFDVPQVTMRTQEWIFHTPSVRMVAKKVGQYPEFYCSGLSCTVKWSDIITDVPETFMEEQRVKLDIPEFKMETTSIKLHIPEVTVGPQKIVLTVPEVTAREPKAEIKQAGSALTQEINTIKAKYEPQIKQVESEMKETVSKAVASAMSDLLTCQMNQNSKTFTAGTKSFEGAIQNMEAASASYNKPEMESLRQQMQIQAEQLKSNFEQQKVRFEGEVLHPVTQDAIAAN